MSHGARQFFLGGLSGFAVTIVPFLLLLAIAPRTLPDGAAESGPNPPLPNYTPPELNHRPAATTQAADPGPAAVLPPFAMPPGVELPEGVVVGIPMDAGRLTVRPLCMAGAPVETEYVTLEEAMESGLCTVAECGTVDSLLASNLGTRPVFAMAGDLLLGGNQDRVLAVSMVLEPGAAGVQVPVFCVEKGRWAVQREDTPRPPEPGRFYKDSSRPTVDLKVKGAAAGGDQQAVWLNVAQVSQHVAATDPTGTGSFRRAFSAPAADSAEAIVRRLRSQVPPDAVGFAVFESDELVALDLFDSSALCLKVRDKVLRSYAMTALSGGMATQRIAVCTGDPLVSDARDNNNEDPSEKPFQDLAENPGQAPSDNESPHPNRDGTVSSIGLSGGIGGGAGRCRQTTTTVPQQECARQSAGRRIHLSYVRR